MIDVSAKVELTGSVVVGSVEGVMVTLGSEPERGVLYCLQVMEVRGRLKSEIDTDKIRIRVSPAITSV